jgi:predicted nucleic acid-binding protein
VGLILDSSFLIASERQGQSVLQILQQIENTFGQVEIGISVVTVAELTHGAYRAADDTRKQRRLSFIDRLCNDVPVYPVTLEIARHVGRLEGELASQGLSVAFEDLAIGVTALHLGFEIATLNLKHYKLIPGLGIASL